MSLSSLRIPETPRWEPVRKSLPFVRSCENRSRFFVLSQTVHVEAKAFPPGNHRVRGRFEGAFQQIAPEISTSLGFFSVQVQLMKRWLVGTEQPAGERPGARRHLSGNRTRVLSLRRALSLASTVAQGYGMVESWSRASESLSSHLSAAPSPKQNQHLWTG